MYEPMLCRSQSHVGRNINNSPFMGWGVESKEGFAKEKQTDNILNHKNGTFRASYFKSYSKCKIKNSWWLDLNPAILVLEATTLLTTALIRNTNVYKVIRSARERKWCLDLEDEKSKDIGLWKYKAKVKAREDPLDVQIMRECAARINEDGSVWPYWSIYWTLYNFLKPLATFNLPKSPTFVGNFC